MKLLDSECHFVIISLPRDDSKWKNSNLLWWALNIALTVSSHFFFLRAQQISHATLYGDGLRRWWFHFVIWITHCVPPLSSIFSSHHYLLFYILLLVISLAQCKVSSWYRTITTEIKLYSPPTVFFRWDNNNKRDASRSESKKSSKGKKNIVNRFFYINLKKYTDF